MQGIMGSPDALRNLHGVKYPVFTGFLWGLTMVSGMQWIGRKETIGGG